MAATEEYEQYWRQRLATECPQQSDANRESIRKWLGGCDTQQSKMEDRLWILRKRYLGVEPQQAYCNLINRLGSIAPLQYEIQIWAGNSRDDTLSRHLKAVLKVLPKVLLQILETDAYMQQQMADIAQLTQDKELKNALLLASTEEYCLQTIDNQPRLVHHFAKYLRYKQPGLTRCPVLI
jgi:hypothetical protein